MHNTTTPADLIVHINPPKCFTIIRVIQPEVPIKNTQHGNPHFKSASSNKGVLLCCITLCERNCTNVTLIHAVDARSHVLRANLPIIFWKPQLGSDAKCVNGVPRNLLRDKVRVRTVLLNRRNCCSQWRLTGLPSDQKANRFTLATHLRWQRYCQHQEHKQRVGTRQKYMSFNSCNAPNNVIHLDTSEKSTGMAHAGPRATQENAPRAASQ